MRSRSGSCQVTPSARPRGMMVTLCTGSALGRLAATIAWPDSWYAVARFVFGEHHRLALGAHADLVLARSKSSMSTRRLLARAANSAASFTRLAISAPEKPGQPRAITCALTSAAIGTLRMWTCRIARDRGCRAAAPQPGGRSGPDASAPGRARQDGWSRRSRSRPASLEPSISTSI